MSEFDMLDKNKNDLSDVLKINSIDNINNINKIKIFTLEVFDTHEIETFDPNRSEQTVYVEEKVIINVYRTKQEALDAWNHVYSSMFDGYDLTEWEV